MGFNTGVYVVAAATVVEVVVSEAGPSEVQLRRETNDASNLF